MNREHDQATALTAEVERLGREILHLKAEKHVLKTAELFGQGRFQAMLEHASVGVSFGDRAGNFIWVNQALGQLMGYPRAALVGMNFRDITVTEDVPTQEVMHARLWNREITHYNLEKRYRAADGHTIYCLVSVALLIDPDNGQDRFISIYTDLTDRRRAERELARSEGRYRDLVSMNPDPIYVSRAGVLVYVNPAAVALFGASHENQLLGREIFDLIQPDYRPKARERYRRMMEQGWAAPLVRFDFLRLDGEVVEVEVTAVKTFWQGEEAIQTGVRDISNHVRAQRRLDMLQRISSAFATSRGDEVFSRVLNELLAAFHCSQGYLGYIGPGGALICPAMSPRFENACPTEERSLHFAADHWEGFWGESLSSREIKLAEGTVPICAGSLSLERGLAAPLLQGDELVGQFLVADKDFAFNRQDLDLARAAADHLGLLLKTRLVERAHAEQAAQYENRLRQSQRLEAVGTLAGGIAHDFNNILAAILGYCELADDRLEGDHATKKHLKQAINGCGRARDLVRQILSFSRPGEHERHPIRLAPLIKESLKLARSTIPSSIFIRTYVNDQEATANADPTQLQQVLMNLCTNAAQAMGESGRLTVQLDQVELSAEDAENLGLAPGPFALLSVSDTGKGMPLEVMERMYEPFFTTRDRGRGTGMGLAVVHGIVKGHGGAISAESQVGKGSTFRVYFPLVTRRGRGETGKLPEKASEGSERILFVDDEPALVDIGQRVLSRLGYTVSSFGDSREALEHFRRNPQDYDLVITDYTMPDINGGELTRQLLEIRRDLPILITTGYSGMMSPERARSLGARKLIMKPLISREIGLAIREVLDE